MPDFRPRILVLGLTRRPPTFIKRRLNKLSEAGVRMTIVLDKRKTQGIHYERKIFYQRLALLRPFFTVKQLAAFVFRVHRSSRLWKISQGPFLRRLKWCLEKQQLLGLGDFDVIHLQWLVEGSVLLLLKSFYPNAPIVVSARGSQVVVYPRFDEMARDQAVDNFRHVSMIHCVSQDIADVCTTLGATKEKVFVNYNGINLMRFSPNGSSRSSPGICLISVGALMWRKGYHFQLQILKQLCARGTVATLRILGDGPDLLSLRYAAHRLGIADLVFFEGEIKEDGVIERLRNSDIYLSTSLAEGLPNSLVEAAACGLPIVTFECEGVKEIVEDASTGYIVPFGDVGLAVDRIMLLTDPKLKFEMSSRARERVEKRFNEDYWVGEMIKKYVTLSLKR